MAQGDTITIEDNGDGSYTVTVSEAGDADDTGAAAAGGQAGPAGQAGGQSDTGDADQPQTVGSVADVLKLVKQELTEGSGSPQAMWQQEASSRDQSGMRQPGAAGPSMSM